LNIAATLADQAKLASTEHVVFNQIHFQILVGDMSDHAEEYISLQTRQSLAIMQLSGISDLSLRQHEPPGRSPARQNSLDQSIL
jgi:hypothetical protein